MEAIIIRGYGGFYIAQSGDKIYTCSLRGRLKKDKNTRIMIGDKVIVTVLSDTEGVVEEILPRTTELIRPRIANVEHCLLLFALADPEPDLTLLDRLLILVQAAGLKPVICFNKCDLAPQSSLPEMYEKAGFHVLKISAEKQIGFDELRDVLRGKVTVLAGPSGAGKSSTLNVLKPALALETGAVSEKLQRGRHTTKYVELWQMDEADTYVADSPGFSRLDLPEGLTAEGLSDLYPEFNEYVAECRYDGCLHHKDDGCAVREQVGVNIDEGRYARYLKVLLELQEREEKKYD